VPYPGRELRERGVDMRMGSFGLVADRSRVPAGVGGGGGGQAEAPQDLPAVIQDLGFLQAATDPEYPPQSFLNGETGQWEGSTSMWPLGVEFEFITPNWGQIMPAAGRTGGTSRSGP
jgi:hypothetical protein